MTNEEAIRQNYVEEYAVAKELGWAVDERHICHNGPRFIKHWSVTIKHHPKPIEGAIHLWKVRDGWMCANIGMARYFKNHRGYPTAIEGMRAEHEKEKIVDEMIDEILHEEQSGV